MSDKTPELGTASRAAMAVLSVLAIVGIVVGIYMTQHHELQLYGGAESGELWGCEADGKVNCDIVNTSEWSEVMGVPLFTWAVPTYWVVLILAGLAVAGRRAALPLLALVGFGATAFSGFLYYISVYEIGYVCLWCMRLYAINLAILVLPLLAGAHRASRPSPALVGGVAGVFLVVSAFSIGTQRWYRAGLLAGAPEVPELAETPDAESPEAGPKSDPTGVLSERSFTVTTEDKREAEMTIGPGDPWKGTPDADVVVVEFGDLECGYCKRAAGELERVVEAYADRVLFVFKHFPMDPACNPGVKNKKHRNACNAAVAAACAQDQGKFWAFHDLAFKNQHQLKVEHLRTYAEAVGVDMDAWQQCVRDPAARERVRSDAAQGAALDIHGTPRIFVNGKLYRGGMSAQQYARLIEIALGTSAQEATQRSQELVNTDLPVKPIAPDTPAMREIRLGTRAFAIDTFEAGVTEGAATVGKHQIPGTRMSWYAARDACQAAGKRLCTEEEWIAACQGMAPRDDDGDGQFADDMVEGTTYPYSDYHARGRCWDGQDRATKRPVYTGEMPGCVSKDGVYDMTGNVEEWVGETEESAVLLGGAFDTSKDFARCYRRNDTFGPGLANLRTGFRCCRSL